MPEETNKQRFVRTLREVADYVESHPFDEDLEYPRPTFNLFFSDVQKFGRTVRAAENERRFCHEL